MSISKKIIAQIIFITVLFLSCNSIKDSDKIRPYKIVDEALYKTIVSKDKEFFDAYNNCDLEKQASMYSNDIEFFHDKGGLMTSKKEIIDATEKYICGKVTRELVEGSIEVYPIKDYGAVQIGFHKFHNNQEPDAPSKPSKFVTIWHNENGIWKMTKVISLH
ncbi:MAG: nuclear transport factor 2 family protein [Flavobacteriaceae bacterium]|nr:nuclear transport factor 2 family protein [Flavobacteriaceae bacterium]